MKNALDEEVPYRTAIDSMSPTPEKNYTQDEIDHSTLLTVLKILQDGVDSLDKWHAFELSESELKLKQQIKAHQLAYDIVAPLLETVKQAVRNNDEKYKQRNGQ